MEQPRERNYFRKQIYVALQCSVVEGELVEVEAHSAWNFPGVAIVIVPSFRRVQLIATPWTVARQASPPITLSRSLHKLMSTESVMPPSHLILCHPLLLLPSIFPSIRVFSNESVLHIRGPKDWNFSFSISPSNEHSGLISYRIGWFDFLAVQRTLKRLFQHHSSKASILWCSAFFMVRLSHSYTTTGKTIVLIIRTFAGKVLGVSVLLFLTSENLDVKRLCPKSLDINNLINSSWKWVRNYVLIMDQP